MHLAVYFPGGSIPGQDPFDDRLAWIAIRALEQAGAFVVPVRYDDDVLGQDPARFESGVRRELRGAVAHHGPTRLTIVGKSRGTFALQIVCAEEFTYPEDTRMIWLTPVWRSDEAWEAACTNTIESLHVVGLADTEYHDPERHAAVAGETVAIPSADHRLEVAGDVLATLESWRAMATAVVRFAGGHSCQDARRFEQDSFVPGREQRRLTNDTIDWGSAIDQVLDRGWARIQQAIAPPGLHELEEAAPGPWQPAPPTEGSDAVQQAGINCHAAVADVATVHRLATVIEEAVDAVRPIGTPELPSFNHAEWGLPDDGRKFITVHRDPDTAGGLVVVLTIRGTANFRIWPLEVPFDIARSRPDLATEWRTAEGDLVFMHSGGWPHTDAHCPLHEVDSPPDGQRLTLTLRHNKRGYGVDYFA